MQSLTKEKQLRTFGRENKSTQKLPRPNLWLQDEALLNETSQQLDSRTAMREHVKHNDALAIEYICHLSKLAQKTSDIQWIRSLLKGQTRLSDD